MDNARFLIALVLAVGVIVLTNVLLGPKGPPTPAGVSDTTAVDTGAAARAAAPAGSAAAPKGTAAVPTGTAAARPAAGTTATPSTPTAPHAAGAPAATVAVGTDTLVVTSPLYRYAISSAGGTVVSARLLKYKSATRKGPVELVPPGTPGLVRYRLDFADSVVDLARLHFSIEGPHHIELHKGSKPITVKLVHSDSAGGPGIVLSYTFDPEHYVVAVHGQAQGVGTGAGTLLIDMGPALGMNEADSAADKHALGYAVDNVKSGISGQNLSKVAQRTVKEGPLFWSAFKNKYFLAAALSNCQDASGDCFGGAIAQPVKGFAGGVELTTTSALATGNQFAFRLYLGPQEYARMAALGHDLQDVNPYGWKIFRPILLPLTHVVVWVLTTMHRVLNLGYGWVLILLGVLIRLILWPLNAKAMRSQLKNMEIQPIIQEVQKKYKNDPERLQKEMMRLYKEEGFNPLGGCLPMLIPYPVLITLFFVFENTIAFRGVGFLWLPDLSRADPLYILPILLGVSMFALQYLSARSTTTTNTQMKVMMWIMPAFMTFIFLRLASGLNLYYAAMNFASLPQQYQIMQERKHVQVRKPSS